MCKKHVRLLQRRKSLLKEVRSQNKSAHLITVGYVGDGYTSIVLGNDPVPLKLQRIFLLRLCEGVLGFTVSPTEDQSSRVCSLYSKKVRSTWAELFSVIKISFQESEHDDDRFRFKRMSTSPHGSEAR